MELNIYLVNSFSENIAEGNPAGVILLNSELPNEQLIKIAADIGKSETAFIREVKPNTYNIRWFSPKKEMPLCGHATLAAARVIFSKNNSSELVFEYSGGTLNILENMDTTISMKFPLDNFEFVESDLIFEEFFPRVPVEKVIFGQRTKKVVIILPKEIELKEIQPNFQKMRESTGIFPNGIGVSKSGNNYDFESRYFNPWAGVDEDPITGSVHTLLAKYWQQELAQDSLVAYQSSHRPGVLFLKLEQEQVIISGKARIIIEGKFFL